VYDAIMSDVEYDDWATFILETARGLGWEGEKVLDLGCGTGNSTFPFYVRGYEVTGLDASAEMLSVAREKLPPVEFVQGEFTAFALGERFDLVVSLFDSLNNLLTPEAFLKAARRVHRHLYPGGIFMFDVNTTAGLRDLWESGRAEGWVGEVHYCWEHSFDPASGLAKVVAYCEDPCGSFTEIHYERPYDPPEVRRLLRRAGFRRVQIVEYPSGEEARADAHRVWAVARR
jgi:ubiquinone/menaquinone biosynthesis C-methylase UbiE